MLAEGAQADHVSRKQIWPRNEGFQSYPSPALNLWDGELAGRELTAEKISRQWKALESHSTNPMAAARACGFVSLVVKKRENDATTRATPDWP